MSHLLAKNSEILQTNFSQVCCDCNGNAANVAQFCLKPIHIVFDRYDLMMTDFRITHEKPHHFSDYFCGQDFTSLDTLIVVQHCWQHLVSSRVSFLFKIVAVSIGRETYHSAISTFK